MHLPSPLKIRLCQVSTPSPNLISPTPLVKSRRIRSKVGSLLLPKRHLLLWEAVSRLPLHISLSTSGRSSPELARPDHISSLLGQRASSGTPHSKMVHIGGRSPSLLVFARPHPQYGFRVFVTVFDFIRIRGSGHRRNFLSCAELKFQARLIGQDVGCGGYLYFMTIKMAVASTSKDLGYLTGVTTPCVIPDAQHMETKRKTGGSGKTGTPQPEIDCSTQS